MAQLQTDLNEFVALLNSHKVEYLVDRVIQLGRPPNRIDLLTTISGVTFQEAWTARAPGSLGAHAVNFIGWDALIRNKQASGRDKDRTDVATLLKIAARRKEPRDR